MESISTIPGLDVAAWERWVSYRKAIKKPLKEASLYAMAIKLSRFGEDQEAVIEQSVSNQWQGLFPLKDKPKTGPGGKPEKTDKQKAADAQALIEADERAARFWEEEIKTPEGKLLLAEALLARYTVRPFNEELEEQKAFLRERVGPLIREADPKKVAGDPRLSSMVLSLYGYNGYRRLKERAGEG